MSFRQPVSFSPALLLLFAACAVPVGAGDEGDGDGDGEGEGDGDGMLPILPSGSGGSFGSGGTSSGIGGTQGIGGTTLLGSGGVGASTGGGAGVGGSPPVSSSAYPFTVTASSISVDGYVTASPWMGYAYTWTGEAGTASDVVYPAEFTGDDLCAWGTLGLSYNATLGLGFSVNQAQGMDPPKGTWDISAASGISYNVKNDGGTPLRIQLKVGTGTYCKEISTMTGTASGTATLSEFNTVCWEGETGTMMPATGTIISIDIVSPGTVDVVRNPAFCVVSLAPVLK